MYAKFKNKTKALGVYYFHEPVLIPYDLDLIQNILVKDFNNFTDRGMFVNEEGDPLSAHLFSLDGQDWRNLRQKFTQTFTSGKMKQMFPIVSSVSEGINELYDSLLEKSSTIEVKDVNARFTTDVIGNCAFGLECNSLKDPNAQFRKVGAEVFSKPRNPLILTLFFNSYPKLGKKLNFKLFSDYTSKFFFKAVKDTVDYRESKNIKRNDFMSILIDMKNGPGAINMNELTAQAFVFFLAGFETSSTTMSNCLYELGRNPHVQERLREEIKTTVAKTNGQLEYESIIGLEYLEKVLKGENDSRFLEYFHLPFFSGIILWNRSK